jgi:Kef-type K+ transport system membrane component KefB
MAWLLAALAPGFFSTAGLKLDLGVLADPAVLGAAGAVLAVAVLAKGVGAYAGARAGRLGHWEGLALGAGLNARGVIQIIVATVGLRLGVLNQAGYTVIVLVAIVTSVLAPTGIRYAVRRLPVTPAEVDRENANRPERLEPALAGAGPTFRPTTGGLT